MKVQPFTLNGVYMMEIEKVAILGAGAMGAYFAGRFYEAGDFSVSLVAGGERYDRLKKYGLVVNGKEYFIPVTHPDEATPPADLIIEKGSNLRLTVVCCFDIDTSCPGH